MPANTLRSTLQRSGIRRRGSPEGGFRYRRASGAPIRDEDRERIERLAIPPAWRNVVIARSAGAKVQAIGLDAAGRWQYLYRASHTARRSRAKFVRLVKFGAALPELRRALHRDMRRPGLPREKVIAGALLFLTASAMRPGGEVYARDNRTFGLSTLRNHHAEVTGDAILLRFRGKHGLAQRHELRSKKLARLLRAMRRLPGRELFSFRDALGEVRDLRRAHLNDYVKEAMGGRFSARDFRTWMGTLLCAAALKAERGVHTDGPKRAVGRAVRATAKSLGNTPAVAREAYIHPAVIEAFLEGRVVSSALASPETLIVRRSSGLDRSERALLSLLGNPKRNGRIASRAAGQRRTPAPDSV